MKRYSRTAGALFGGLIACASMEIACSSASDTTAAASATTSSGASGTASSTGAGATAQSGATSSGSGGGSPQAPEFVVKFDPTVGQLAEGLFVDGDTAYVGIAPLGAIVKVALPEGTVESFAQITGVPSMGGGFTLGIVLDTAKNAYVGQSAGSSGPAPGIYRFTSAGGKADVPWASDPEMNFPNGLLLDSKGDLYVADSGGTIFKIDTGTATVTKWSADALLQGADLSCMYAAPFPLGANGIVTDGKAMYVSNTNSGSIVRIPINADGSAGTATALVGPDCEALGGVDGLARDTDGTLLAAINSQSKLVRIGEGGEVTQVYSGSPLDNPASIVTTSLDSARVALITNASFFSTEKQPGLLRYDLP